MRGRGGRRPHLPAKPPLSGLAGPGPAPTCQRGHADLPRPQQGGTALRVTAEPWAPAGQRPMRANPRVGRPRAQDGPDGLGMTGARRTRSPGHRDGDSGHDDDGLLTDHEGIGDGTLVAPGRRELPTPRTTASVRRHCGRNRSDQLFQTLLIAATGPAQVETRLRRKSAASLMARSAQSSPLARPDIGLQSDSSCHQNVHSGTRGWVHICDTT